MYLDLLIVIKRTIVEEACLVGQNQASIRALGLEVPLVHDSLTADLESSARAIGTDGVDRSVVSSDGNDSARFDRHAGISDVLSHVGLDLYAGCIDFLENQTVVTLNHDVQVGTQNDLLEGKYGRRYRFAIEVVSLVKRSDSVNTTTVIPSGSHRIEYQFSGG